jgi:hypothetical protein
MMVVYMEELTNLNNDLFKTNILGKISFATLGKRGSIREDIKNFAMAELDKIPKKQKDLLYFTDIFVSQGWNLNDDIFLKEELINACDTIPLKPVDWDHTRNIIGTNYDSYILTKNGEKLTIEEALKYDEEIDIASESVVYKWLFPEEASKIQESADIESENFNEYQTSMECYFKNYDYGILRGDETVIMKRDEKTSFLDKYLKVCGGRGHYNGEKIGRILRGIIFGGKGIVKNPANIESVIMCAAKIMPNESEDISKKIILGNVDLNKEDVKMAKEEEKNQDGKANNVELPKEEVKSELKEQTKDEIKNEKAEEIKTQGASLEIELAASMLKMRECSEAINKLYDTISQYSIKVNEILAKLVEEKEKFINNYAQFNESNSEKIEKIVKILEEKIEKVGMEKVQASEQKQEEKMEQKEKEQSRGAEDKQEEKIEQKQEEKIEQKQEEKAEQKEEEKMEQKEEAKEEEKNEQKQEENTQIEKGAIDEVKKSIDELKKIVQDSQNTQLNLENNDTTNVAKNDYEENFPADIW